MTAKHPPAQPLPACVTEYIDRVVRRMRFPQADTPSSVTFPFSFGVGG